MSASRPNPQDIIHAYRHLYRGLLQAVQYSMPARFTARNKLRDAFRKEDPASFNQEKIERTLEFLKIAAQETGLEHRIVKNLLYAAYWRKRQYIWADRDFTTTQIHYGTLLEMTASDAMTRSRAGKIGDQDASRCGPPAMASGIPLQGVTSHRNSGEP